MRSENSSPRWLKQEKLGFKQGEHDMIYLAFGDTYTGQWLDDQKHGQGVYYNARNKDLYEGEFKFGKRDGFGILFIPKVNKNNTKQKIESLFDDISDPKDLKKMHADIPRHLLSIHYSGEWKNNKKHGLGLEYFDNGIYEGQYRDGSRNGWGKMSFTNGKIYEGEYHNGAQHGQGILIEENGDRYEGTWMNGKKEGPGKFIYLSKKQLYEGEWHNNMPACGALLQFPNLEQLHPFPKIELQDYKQVLDDAKHQVQIRREEQILRA